MQQTALGTLSDLLLLLSPSLAIGPLSPLAISDADARTALEHVWGIAEPLLNRTVAGEDGAPAEPAEDHPVAAAKAAAVAAVGRLVLHYPGAPGQWLAGCLLSHLAAHGDPVHAAISEVLRALRRAGSAEDTAALFESAMSNVFLADDAGEVRSCVLVVVLIRLFMMLVLALPTYVGAGFA